MCVCVCVCVCLCVNLYLGVLGGEGDICAEQEGCVCKGGRAAARGVSGTAKGYTRGAVGTPPMPPKNTLPLKHT